MYTSLQTKASRNLPHWWEDPLTQQYCINHLKCHTTQTDHWKKNNKTESKINSTIMNKQKRKWIRHHWHQHKLTYVTHSRQKWISSSSFSISTAHKHLDSVHHFFNSCKSNHRVNHKRKILNCTKKANHTSDTYCFFSTTHP